MLSTSVRSETLVRECMLALEEGRTIRFLSDFDGTAASFTSDPEMAIPEQGFIQALDLLTRRPGVSVGIVTGRPLAFVEQHFPQHSIDLYCSYSAETRVDGKYHVKNFVSVKQYLLDDAFEYICKILRSNNIPVSASVVDAEIQGGVILERALTRIVAYFRAGAKADPTLKDRCVAAWSGHIAKDASSPLSELTQKRGPWHHEFELVDDQGNVLNKETGVREWLMPNAEANACWQIDESSLIGDLFIYAGDDDVGDLGLAQMIKGLNGIVIAVTQETDQHQLTALADVVFEDVASYSQALYDVGLKLVNEQLE